MVSMLLHGTTNLPEMFTSDSFLFLEGIGENLAAPTSGQPRAFVTHMPFRFLPKDVVDKKIKVSLNYDM